MTGPISCNLAHVMAEGGIAICWRRGCLYAGNCTAKAVAETASAAAREGALATKDMAGRGGRAGYVNPDLLKGVPDPGAFAVAEWMAAIAKGLE